MQKETNALLWGAIAAAIGGGVVLIAQLVGSSTEPNALLQTPASAAGISFFWGWVAGSVKNWYGERLRRSIYRKER